MIVGLILAGESGASEYPTKTIQMIVGYAPGGPASLGARIVSEEVSKADRCSPCADQQTGGSGSHRCDVCGCGETGWLYDFWWEQAPIFRRLLPCRRISLISCRISCPLPSTSVHPTGAGREKRRPLENPYTILLRMRKKTPGNIKPARTAAGSLYAWRHCCKLPI